MRRVFFLLTVLVFLSGERVYSQVVQPDQEVLLTFNYPVIGRVYVGIQHDWTTNESMIPVSEVFSLLGIFHEFDKGTFSINGFYLEEENEYRIDFRNHVIELGGEVKKYEPSKFRIAEKDYYLAPEVLEAAFGLKFIINMNTLILSLETDKTMPVVLREQRTSKRGDIFAPSLKTTYYPLRYKRKRSVFQPGFLDYSLSSSNALSEGKYILNYSLAGGVEFLGGDVQGTHVGTYSSLDESYYSLTRNLRWRYAILDNAYLSQIKAGQIRTNGLIPRGVKGVSLTNNPIEPRQLQSVFLLDGTTVPDSEVELYLNDQVIGYTVADNLGYYRFEVPLSYGTSLLRKLIYTPDGRRLVDEQRIQTPFQFLPPGVVTYYAEGGVVESGLQTGLYDAPMVHGNVGVGLTNWLTAKVGTEYIEGTSKNDRPSLYGSFTGRIFNQYLLNAEIAPDAFYRLRGSVIYSSSRSLTANFTYFEGYSLYNVRGADHQIEANYYTPFNIGSLRAGFRLGGTYYTFSNRSQTQYNSDIYFQIARVNLRFNYRDDVYFLNDGIQNGVGRLRGSVSYLFPSNKGVPNFLQGTHVRLSSSFERRSKSFREANVQISKNILQAGRLYVNGSRNFSSGINSFQIGISIDIKNHVRSSTDYRNTSGTHVVRQNFRGSLGYDDNPDKVFTSIPEQVGRAAAAVILFVDNNQSGSYDEGEEILPYPAIRLDQSAFTSVDSEGILRLTQLQSYYRYDMEVNRSSIPNPTLVPQREKFSFIADPNQYKRIEIPFYRSGILEGKVAMLNKGAEKGLGGIRMLLKGKNNDFEKQIRSLYGGSFFVMDIPPGHYTMEVDTTQLNFLEAVYNDSLPEFEIKSVAEGDYIGDMNIYLKQQENSQACTIQIQAGSYRNKARAEQMASELTANLGKEFGVYYNAKSLLYAVRSAPISTLSDAIEKDIGKVTAWLPEFRKAFKENRFITVVRCGKKEVFEPLKKIKYLIQIAEYSENEQAQKMAKSISKELGIPTLVKENEDAPPRKVVYAGPFSEYKNTLKVRAALIAHKGDEKPIIRMDSTSFNQLDFAFKLYRGKQDKSFGQPAFSQSFSERISDIVLSDIAEIDFDRMFEKTVISWSKLLQLQEELSNKQGLQNLEIILFERTVEE